MNGRLNIARISLTSFLAYFIMSAIITPLGVVNRPIAEYFDISITASTAVFSSLTTGILVGSLVAIFIFEHMRIKAVVLSAAALIALSLLSIRPLDSFAGLTVGLFFAGVGCGVSLSAAAAVITGAYGERLRASMLLLTDSFYSGAGTLSAFLAVWLIGRQWHWWSVYLLALCAIACLLALALVSDYPETAAGEDADAPAREAIRDWPAALHLCGLSLMMYLLGVVTVYSWVPNYAQTALAMDQAAAGNLVGRMFSGMFFGQLVMFFLVLRLPVRTLLSVCMLLATLMTAAIRMDQQLLAIQLIMPLLGLVGGGVLKVAISYGTTLSPRPSPKMVSYLMFYTALGTAIAPALSAWVVERTSAGGAMTFATFCYAGATLLLLFSFASARHGRVQAGGPGA